MRTNILLVEQVIVEFISLLVTTAGRKRGRGRPSIKKEEEETDAQSIMFFIINMNNL